MKENRVTLDLMPLSDEPMILFVMFLIVIGLPAAAAAIAANRGRSGGIAYGITLLLGVGGAICAARITGNDVTAATVGFFFQACCIIAAALLTRDSEIAAQTGAFGAYVKCPQCAEPVRREARICKHCRSDLTQEMQSREEQITAFPLDANARWMRWVGVAVIAGIIAIAFVAGR